MGDEKRLRVIYNDPTVHCIDVMDGIGERVVRVRARSGRVDMDTFTAERLTSSLSPDEAEEFARALESLAAQARKSAS